MAMKWLARLVWSSVMVLFASAAMAQPMDARDRRPFSQAELDQMLAPIALYPDALLSQIFMAASYPQDVYEAASWSRANPGLSGDTAVRAVENEPWDPSVVSLVAFPQVLAMMEERRDWTERLGDAYVSHPGRVMDTVQELRARADAAGSLRSSEEIVVKRHGDDYLIEPPAPDVVYVPYYDPRVAYGTWWWPDYQPVYWGPWAGYNYYPGYRGFGWGYGVTLGSGFFFGAIDWPRRYVRYSNHRPWYYHGRDYRGGHRWTHDRDHRWRRDRHWGDRRVRDGGERRVDGRWRDGQRDGYRDHRGDGRTDRRDWRRDRPGGVAAPQVGAQQGFFPRDDARTRALAPDAVTRPDSRTSRSDATTGRDQRRERIAPEAQGSGFARPADGRYAPRVPQAAPRQIAPQQVAPQQGPAVQPRVAPQQRHVPQQRHAPQQRVAPAPQQRGAPAPRQQAAPQPAQAAPLSRSSSERPSRSAPAAEPAQAPEPVQRSGGRGMTR
jgi:hypothetical protein